MSKITYTDLFKFNDKWYIREGYNHVTKTTFHVISCPHKLVINSLFSDCEQCGAIPENVLITFKMFL